MRTFEKIRSRRVLARLAEKLRRARKKIVFTNGCFDLLHVGHVCYLEKAKQLGDVLIVAVNSDASVRRIKGAERPWVSEKDRVRIVAGLQAVDYVTLFSEETPRELIQEIRPHVIVKGADWEKRDIVGAEEVRAWGGQVRRIPLVAGRSTTSLIETIRRR